MSSDFVTECPECGADLLAIGPTITGPGKFPDKPDAVECAGANRHRFPVLEVDEPRRFRLGDLET